MVKKSSLEARVKSEPTTDACQSPKLRYAFSDLVKVEIKDEPSEFRLAYGDDSDDVIEFKLRFGAVEDFMHVT